MPADPGKDEVVLALKSTVAAHTQNVALPSVPPTLLDSLKLQSPTVEITTGNNINLHLMD